MFELKTENRVSRRVTAMPSDIPTVSRNTGSRSWFSQKMQNFLVTLSVPWRLKVVLGFDQTGFNSVLRRGQKSLPMINEFIFICLCLAGSIWQTRGFQTSPSS